MRLYLLLFLAVVNGGISTYRPWEESPCPVVDMDVFCQNKGLKQIPLAFHPNIKKLDVSKNKLENITEMPLTFYTFIQDLDLSSNQISYIQPGIFREMRNLKHINLSDNFLDRLVQRYNSGIGSLPHTESLDLSSNSLHTGMAEPFLQNAPSLQHLYLSGNSIMMVSQKMFLGTPALVEVDLHNNVVMDIEEGAFEHLAHLFKLDLSMNSITCVSEFSLRQLQILDLSQNSIESFHTAESGTEYKLSQIDLSENKLLHFPVLPKINNLTHLNVSRNLIKLGLELSTETIGIFDYDWLESTFQPLNRSQLTSANLSKLLHLDLSYNKIETIPPGFFDTMSSLQHLNLSRNCLQAFVLEPSHHLTSLATLDLSYNSLVNFSIPYNTLVSLQNLYLQNNHIRVLESTIFQGFPNIRLLDLRSNSISICNRYSGVAKDRLGGDVFGCASFFGIPNLHHVYLSDNTLTNLPKNAFDGTPLTVLDLSKNRGLQVKVNALSGLESSLEYLYLQENDLSTLNIDLPLFIHLKHLNLSGNHLTWLPTWRHGSSLENLDLRNNSFSSLQSSDIAALETTLKVLYLTGNPLTCCGNVWLPHIIQQARVELPDLELMTCLRHPEKLLVSQIHPPDCEKEDLKKTNIIIILTFLLLFLIFTIGVGSFFYFRRQRFNRHFKAYD